MESELSKQEEQLRMDFLTEKAAALAEQSKESSDELREARFKVEDKWKAKLEKLAEAATQSKKATARDVKQLTEMHRAHVQALEKSLKEETSRHDKARSQIKALTIARANEAAKNASERETAAQAAASNIKEVEQLRLMTERATKQRDDSESRAQAAMMQAKRISQDRRLDTAALQGLR